MAATYAAVPICTLPTAKQQYFDNIVSKKNNKYEKSYRTSDNQIEFKTDPATVTQHVLQVFVVPSVT